MHYVDIATQSKLGADFELRPICQGCCALTFALAGLSCFIESFLCIRNVVYFGIVQAQLRPATVLHRDKLIIS